MAGIFGEYKNASDERQSATQLSDDILLSVIGQHSLKDVEQGATSRKRRSAHKAYRVARNTGDTDRRSFETQTDDLCKRYGISEIDALAQLYDRYHQMMYSLAYRIVTDVQLAEDLLQETFLAVWHSAGSYSVQGGSVRTWLFSIIHHRTIDYLRQVQMRSLAGNVSFDELEHSDTFWCADAWDETWRNVQGAYVRQALTRLSMEQRIVIELAYFQGWSHTEIAREYQLPLGTVKARMRLGLAHLRHLLAELDIYEM
ncbi:hypothetical protein ccbrp13_03260 [Ktedonobacteria bacterium brp13]|nr:hypothetical protein ccbrp13_03260 [Ktedonobacteria bacterium brp13]